MQKDKVIIYTDGAAKGNPGKGGWAAILFIDKEHKELGGRTPHATNNQMELTAPIEALKYLKNKKMSKGIFDMEIEFFSDSKYVILGITEWIFNWQKNNWRNAAKKPVLNKELWEELFELTQEFKPKWNYVAGHTGDKWNERADEIATSFADDVPIELVGV